MRLFRFSRTLVLSLLVVASLTFNVATVAFSSVAMLVATAYEAVTGAASVAGSLRREVDSKSKTISSLSDDLDAKNRRIAALSDDLAVKNRQLGTLTDEVASLRKPKTVNYRGQQKAVGEAVADTANRLSRRTASAAARNVSSVFAEAIPFFGIAVIVGVTAWDLKDSCDTMKDLHQLDVAFNPDAAFDAAASEVCGLEVPSKQEVWEKVKASPTDAWAKAQTYVPDLPEFDAPRLPDWELPDIDWKFWD